MPYSVRKAKCKQTDGDRGTFVLSYTDNKGKRHRNCHTSRKKARAQISAIEMPEGVDEIEESWVPLATRIANLLEEELAQLVGASRETVNKALADFAQRGWIRLESRQVMILDVERLGRRAR